MLSRVNFKSGLVIANPVSGQGKAERFLPDVLAVFKRVGWSVDALRTEKAGDARKAAAAFDGEIIVTFGGDGTFNEVLNGVAPDGPALAVIPAGTGNVLAKELRMSLDPCKAARAIVEGDICDFDVGRANGRRFACMCGAGLDAHIVRLLHDGRDGTITKFHYMPFLLENALRPPNWAISVELDGELYVEDVNIACISNTKSYGGPIELTPHANPQDRWFDITTARVESPLDMPALALAALTRGLTDCNYTRCGRARMIKVKSTSPKTPYQIDGDFAGMLPLTVVMENEPMQIVRAPAGRRRNSVMPPI